MILKRKAFKKTCTNYETKGKPRTKPHTGIEPEFNKNSVCMERNSSTPIPLGHIAVDIRSVVTCTVQVKAICAAQKWPPFLNWSNPCFFYFDTIPYTLNNNVNTKSIWLNNLIDVCLWYCIETTWAMFQTVL